MRQKISTESAASPLAHLLPEPVLPDQRNGPHVIESSVSVVAGKDPQLPIVHCCSVGSPGHWRADCAPNHAAKTVPLRLAPITHVISEAKSCVCPVRRKAIRGWLPLFGSSGKLTAVHINIKIKRCIYIYIYIIYICTAHTPAWR